MSPAALLGRAATYLFPTEADQHTSCVAAWLEAEGYTRAAEVLRLQIQPFETVSQQELLPNTAARAGLVAVEPPIMVHIWSTDRLAFWRANCSGYTVSRLDAGIYPFADAWKATSHCGPEKGIVYEVLVARATDPARQSGWLS